MSSPHTPPRYTRGQALADLLRERIVLLDGAMGTMIQRLRLDEAAYRGTRFADWKQDVKGNNYIYVLDPVRTDEATARKVLVERVTEYQGRMSIRPLEAGALKGGEGIVDEGAKNVTDGLTVRVAK